MQSPKVSIIIPNFNRKVFISETLQSVINQTYPNWECLVVDDGSTDDSPEIIQSFSKKDNRVRFLQRNREPKGAPTCRNIGIEASTGEYIVFLDSDDIMMDYCLMQRIETIQASSENKVDVSIFPMAIFNQEIKSTGLLYSARTTEEEIYRFLRSDITWTISCPFWPKTILQNLGSFDEIFPNCQDFDLHLRLLESNYTYQLYYHLPPDTFYRQHEEEKIYNPKDYLKVSKGIVLLIEKHIQIILQKEYKFDRKKSLINFSILAKDCIRNLLISGFTEEAIRLNRKFRNLGVLGFFTHFRISFFIVLYRLKIMKIRGMVRLWNLILIDKIRKTEWGKHYYELNA